MKLELNSNQSAVIPYRITKRGMEILLITSLRKKNWIIPKGYIEYNLTPFESAKKEAYEEAGIIGSNETMELGYFKFVKPTGSCWMKVYSMEVNEMLEEYPEMNERKRKWFTPEEAIEKISIKEVADMIRELSSMLKVS